MAVFNGANLTFTYTRLRPFTLEPRPNPNGANDREFPNRQDRIAAQYVMTRGAWVSESRIGWNKAYLARLDKFLSVIGPNQPAEIMPYGRRVASFSVSGLFGTPHSEILDMAGTAYSLEQKFSRGYQRHLVKAGFRFMRETGSHINPEDPAFTYQNYADLLANVVNSHNTTYGAPPHGSRMDQYGAFIQDDWRLGNNFVLNLGLRWDYYGVAKVYATTPVPVELVNLENPTDLRRMDFGPKRDPLKPYEPDGNNIGPRVGFAWTLGQNEATVIRGGVGYLYSPTLPMTVRQAVNHPTIPYRVVYNRTESAARNIRWPMYTDDALPLAQADSAGRAAVFSLVDTNISAPYTIQSMLSVQRAFGRTMAAEVGLPPHRWQRLPAAAPIYSGVRQTDRSAAQPGNRLARRLLRGQQSDDGLQRPADIAPKAVLQQVLVGRQLHAGQERVHAGRRSLRVLHHQLQQHPGLLGSGI